MGNAIDLRSDTVTQPTAAMREAMAKAEVGDDVYEEDPTVRRLEEYAADLLGKEAALFVTSGTQGNQVAIATHVQRGDEVIAEAESHVFMYEAAGVAVLAGAQLRQIKGNRGSMKGDDVRAAIREHGDVHQPETTLICVEDTHNRAGGAVLPLADLRELRAIADANGIPIHMDGARLFNAAVASGVAVKEIAAAVDSVQFCLSKGLCAPVGSLLVGKTDFIRRARQWRKRLGGGLRQVGVLAAPGLIALQEMVERLADDHVNAQRLAEGLANISGLHIEPERVDTNIVIVELDPQRLQVEPFVEALARECVLASGFGANRVRFVTHYGIDREDIDRALEVISSVAGER